jgi:hypothetical protein
MCQVSESDGDRGAADFRLIHSGKLDITTMWCDPGGLCPSVQQCGKRVGNSGRDVGRISIPDAAEMEVN